MTTAATAREHALLLLQLDRPEEALEALARDFDAHDPWAWHTRTAALLALDRYDEAVRVAEDGLAQAPEHDYLLDALAAARMGAGDLAGAEQAILQALRIDAENAGFLTRYAYVVAHAGQLEKAEKLVLRALSIDPEDDFALRMHALLAVARDDRGQAIARSRELLRHVPEDPVGHRLIGAAHSENGRVDEAADHLTRAVQLDPADDDVAEAAREARLRSHWLLWPLRPGMRWGVGPLWIGVVAVLFALRSLGLHVAAGILGLVWIVYCVYSWVVPPLLRRLARRW